MRIMFLIFLFAAPAFATQIVASNPMLADLAKDLVQDSVTVTSLLAISADPHLAELRPADFLTLKNADIIFINGEGFETWELKIPVSIREKVVKATANLKLLTITNSSSSDPHFWHDPRLIPLALANLADKVGSVDPKLKPALTSRLKILSKKYEKLFGDCQTQLKPVSNRRLIASHDAFEYFAKAFNLEIRSPQGWTTQGDLRPTNIAQLKEWIRSQKVKAIFEESGEPSPILKKLSNETGATMAGVLFADMLTSRNGEAPTVEAMIFHNCSTIARALK